MLPSIWSSLKTLSTISRVGCTVSNFVFNILPSFFPIFLWSGMPCSMILFLTFSPPRRLTIWTSSLFFKFKFLISSSFDSNGVFNSLKFSIKSFALSFRELSSPLLILSSRFSIFARMIMRNRIYLMRQNYDVLLIN